MENRKINIDREPISSEEITKGMDFKGLMEQHAAVTVKPWYSKGWFLTSAKVTAVAAVAVTVTLLVFQDAIWGPEETTDPGQEQEVPVIADNGSPEAARPFIHAPMPEVDLPSRTYMVDATTGAELVYNTGSLISVPRNAFVDANGQVVAGMVEVRYTEYHDPVDFFLSGVSMEYDSAGEHYAFQSAGMLGIAAYQNGEPVYANPDNLIQVAIASGQEGDFYNVYYLDTTNSNWAFQGKDAVIEGAPDEFATERILATLNDLNDRYDSNASVVSEFLTPESSAMQDDITRIERDLYHVQEQIRDLKNHKPQKPARFDIDILESEFPELTGFKNVKFELGVEVENNDFSIDDYSVEWEDILLEENEKGVNYKLILTKGSKSKTFIVYPVEEGERTDAMITFEKKFSEYNDKLVKKSLKEEELIKELEAKKREFANAMSDVSDYHAELEQLEQDRLAQMEAAYEDWKQNYKAASKLKAKVTRAFTISKFGFWNCDSPEKMPSGRTVAMSFVDAQNNKVELLDVYHVDRTLNGVIHYWPVGLAEFSFNPETENLVWGVTPTGQLAVCREAVFGAISVANEQELVIEIADRKFKNAAEIKAFLNI